MYLSIVLFLLLLNSPCMPQTPKTSDEAICTEHHQPDEGRVALLEEEEAQRMGEFSQCWRILHVYGLWGFWLSRNIAFVISPPS